jgi:hypothetical protein
MFIVNRQPLDYAGPNVASHRKLHPATKWALIVVALAVGGCLVWIVLLAIHWFSLGPMGP